MQSMPNPTESQTFWRDTIAWRQAITPKVLRRVAIFGTYAVAIAYLHAEFGWVGLAATPIGYTGGILALLLVLRSNAGYDRWWEARKLWGGIVNQSRNLAVQGLDYGPEDVRWRQRFVNTVACFSHAARQSLRSERNPLDFAPLLQTNETTALMKAKHMPLHVARQLAMLLKSARNDTGLDSFAFLSAEKQRCALLDHLGGCERILKTPYPRIHSIKLRRFLLIYLLGLPLAIASSSPVLMAGVTMLVAYPLLAIDQIAHELENPFSTERACHLPLNAICKTIEDNLLALLEEEMADDKLA